MILIRGGRVATMAGPVFDGGDVLIGDDGKIAAVGMDIPAPQGAEIIDAKGLWVTPGIVDAHCHIGMEEDGMGFEGDDVNEMTSPVTAQLRALDAINPKDRSFTEARRAGVTSVVTGPGSANVIGGTFAALKTRPGTIEQMAIRPVHSLKTAFGENPKRVYSGKKTSPSTRMATAAIFRETFVKAQEYLKKVAAAGDDASKLPERDFKLDPIIAALKGELPVKMHAHRADDITTAIRLANEFSLRFTLDHCTEGYLMLDELVNSGAAGFILGPLFTTRSKIELNQLSYAAPAYFEKAGVPFALMTDHPVIPEQYLPVCAGLMMRDGLSEMGALAAITSNAAKVAFLFDRVGSLEPGKDADVVLWNGFPLEVRTKVERVFIDGKAMD